MSDEKPHVILARKTDELREKIEAAERAIDTLRLGVTAQVVIGEGEALSWQRIGDKWGLGYVYPKQTVPLVSASRAARVRAVAALPALVEALHAAVERDLQEVDGALKGVDAFLTAFKGAE